MTNMCGPHVMRTLRRCAVLHGGRNQDQREASIKGFRDDTYNILIATDVAGRGIDVPDVALVINYDMPKASTRSHGFGCIRVHWMQTAQCPPHVTCVVLAGVCHQDLPRCAWCQYAFIQAFFSCLKCLLLMLMLMLVLFTITPQNDLCIQASCCGCARAGY